MSFAEAEILYGEPEPETSGRKRKQKRSNAYEPYLAEIERRVKAGDTVAQIHRDINAREGLGYNVEVLRRLILREIRDAMPKTRRWANQYGICEKA